MAPSCSIFHIFAEDIFIAENTKNDRSGSYRNGSRKATMLRSQDGACGCELDAADEELRRDDV